MTLIRAARPEDSVGILAILNPIIAETTITFSPSQLSEVDLCDQLSDHQKLGMPFLVAENDRIISGYAKYGPFRTGKGYARTAEITVHLAPSARGMGLGKRLVSELEDHARSAGLRSLIAGISAENVQAVAFHEKFGFEHVGLVRQAGYKFERFIDLVLMQKFV